MSDFSADFDPRSVGWWHRRSVIRRLKHTPWLTGADRDLRVQRARAAQSRGELNALTRDLEVGGPVGTTQVAWRSAPGSQSYGQAPQPPATVPPPRQAPAAPRKRSLRSSLLIGGLVLLVTCGGGLVSCVSAIVDSVQEMSSESSPSVDLLSPVGWSQMIADLDDTIDIRVAVEATVRPGAATVALPDGPDAVSDYYYDGDINLTGNANRNQGRAEFDLTLVEGEMVESAVALAREHAGVDDSTEAWVLVSATVKDQPILTVTFPDEPDGYSVSIDLDGSVVAESGVS